MLHNNLRIIM